MHTKGRALRLLKYKLICSLRMGGIVTFLGSKVVIYGSGAYDPRSEIKVVYQQSPGALNRKWRLVMVGIWSKGVTSIQLRADTIEVNNRERLLGNWLL